MVKLRLRLPVAPADAHCRLPVRRGSHQEAQSAPWLPAGPRRQGCTLRWRSRGCCLRLWTRRGLLRMAYREAVDAARRTSLLATGTPRRPLPSTSPSPLKCGRARLLPLLLDINRPWITKPGSESIFGLRNFAAVNACSSSLSLLRRAGVAGAIFEAGLASLGSGGRCPRGRRRGSGNRAPAAVSVADAAPGECQGGAATTV